MVKIASSILGRLNPASARGNGKRNKGRRLPVTISLLDPKTRAAVRHPSQAIPGYLRDINRKGLSLVMPSINCGDPFFICSSHLLLVTLKFQNRDIHVEAYPARYDIDESQDEYKYLIGARILRINRSDRKYIDQYLKDGSYAGNFVRSLTQYLRVSIMSRLRIRRSGMRLPLTLSISETKSRWAQAPTTTTTAPGYLNDLSKTGLSVVIPGVRFGDRYPVGENYRMRIKIQLPNRLVTINATPIRYNKLEADGGENAYLIGARIDEMEASDRKQLVKYIKQVKRRKTVTPQTAFVNNAEPL